MKKATFKRKYVTDTIFGEKDFEELINKGTVIHRNQLTHLYTLFTNGTLPQYLVENSYSLNYDGVTDNSVHQFIIKNGTNKLELTITDAFFRQYFKVETDSNN